MELSQLIKSSVLLFCSGFLMACGSSSSDDGIDTPLPVPPTHIPVPDVIWPQHDANLRAALRDTNGETSMVSGTIYIKPPQDAQEIHQYDLHWIDISSEETIGEVIQTILATELSAQSSALEIDGEINMPNENSQLVLIAKDINDLSLEQDTIIFQDFTGNALVSGKGGTIAQSWVYGEDRDFLKAHVETINGNDICSFDNGLVMIIDMENEGDQRNDIVVDDDLYSAYSFNCSDSFEHIGKEIWSFMGIGEEDILVAYSPLNDALHYATITYDMMFKYLGRPPFNEKFRLRVHYGGAFDSDIFWDGAYTNFGDQFYSSSYGSVGLDVVAHELGHGFLNHNTPLKVGLFTYHRDATSLHEAFSDMSGAAAKYFYLGEPHWQHGEEINSSTIRDGSKIIVTEGGLPSYLDYVALPGLNYKNMGMVTYPFYVLTNKWGMDRSYPLMLDAAQYCWQPFMIFPEIAQCVLDAAINRNEPAQDVIDAFKEVKIKLFENGTLAHFDALQIKRNIAFSDTSVSTSETSEWHWDFGDGLTSNEQNPVHDYIDGGRYHPVLTVTDLEGDTDTYTRPIDVFTDYCAPTGLGAEQYIEQISINESIIDVSDKSIYDYTETVIPIVAGSDIHIIVQGTSNFNLAEYWGIWLDINDDGEFDESLNSAEILYSEPAADSENYGLDIQVNIPESLPDSPLRLRISGERYSKTACETKIKSTADIFIQKN